MRKQRYFLKLSYKGTRYHGWQVQPNALTVQEVLEQDLEVILGENMKLTGCGRTDTGVHARVFYAHFDIERKGLNQDREFLFRLNGKLPEDIVVHQVFSVLPEAHARYSAISRTYEYHILRFKHAFHRDLAHYVYGHLDLPGMQRAAAMLKEYSDFASFSKVDADTENHHCRIDLARWTEQVDLLIFTIQADRFLRNMVRALVGTMIEIGLGKIDLEGFCRVIESRNRSTAGPSAPAKGLFLKEVEYPEEIFLNQDS